MRDIEAAPPHSWTLEIHRDFHPTLEAWAALEACASASFYQTRGFAIPWQDTLGQDAGVSPFIILLRDRFGDAAALFPFGLRRKGGLAFVEFLGGKDSNANIGLFRPGFAPSADDLRRVLAEAARAGGVDAYILANQPLRWEEFDNPLAALLHQASPSFCYSARLAADGEAFQKRQLSADARKKLRAKRRKLEETGAVSLLSARTDEEARRLLDVFLAQKRQRFDEQNIAAAFDSPAGRSFLARGCLSRVGGRGAAVELHGLLAGERIVAIYGGGVHRGRFHGMFNSFDMTPQVARCSPGELLLALLVDAKGRQGLDALDLGIGESRYKSTWCDRAEPLFDTLLPMTTKGRLFVAAEAARRRLKRAVKQNAHLWSIAQNVRRRLRLS